MRMRLHSFPHPIFKHMSRLTFSWESQNLLRNLKNACLVCHKPETGFQSVQDLTISGRSLLSDAFGPCSWQDCSHTGGVIRTPGNNTRLARYSLWTQIINYDIQIFHFINRVGVETLRSLLVVSMTTGSGKSSPTSASQTLICSQSIWGQCWTVGLWTGSGRLLMLALDSGGYICLRMKAWETLNTHHFLWP